MTVIILGILALVAVCLVGWTVWRSNHARPCITCQGTMYRIPFSGGTVSRVPHVIQTYVWKCEVCKARCRIDGFDKIVAERS